ncbi:MAG: hypothetical protein ACOC93_03790, partial [Planctomycetota bacterium]
MQYDKLSARIVGTAVAVALLGGAAPAVGEIHEWTDPSGGHWVNALNWDPSGVPGTGDRAIFDLGDETYTVDREDPGLPFPSPPPQIHELRVGDDTLTLDFAGHDLTTTGVTVVGRDAASLLADVGRLNLANGTMTTPRLTLGVEAASSPLGGTLRAQGTLAIDGGDASLRLRDQEVHTVGDAGQGTVLLSGGGQIVPASLGEAPEVVLGETDTGIGEVNVADAGSDWRNIGRLRVGVGGTGTVEIRNGGDLNSELTTLAEQGGASADVTVEGSTARLDAGDLYVGGDDGSAGGTATLTVGSQGRVTSEATRIWPDGTVELAGGLLSAGTLSLS